MGRSGLTELLGQEKPYPESGRAQRRRNNVLTRTSPQRLAAMAVSSNPRTPRTPGGLCLPGSSTSL